MAVTQPGAFHTFEDTLATGIITGGVVLGAARGQIAPVLPPDWVFGMEMRVYSDDDYTIASADDDAAEVPGSPGLWLPLSTINAWEKVWFKALAGTPTLYYIIEGKIRGSTL